MAGQDGRRRSGRQQTEEPAASQDEPGSTERPPPRRSGRTASATPAPEAGAGKKKGASGRGGAKSAPPKAGGSKRSRSPSPAPPVAKKAAAAKGKGKAAADDAALPGKGGKPPSGRKKQVAPASGGKSKAAQPAGKGKAAASGGKGKATTSAKGKAAGSSKAKVAPQKIGGRGRRGAPANDGEEAASDEEEDEQEASGSEASEEEPAASGSEASGSDEGSDEEAESGEGSDEEAGPEEESEEESEEEIDQTIYAPPKTAALPEEVTILEGDAEHGVAPVTAPSAAVGELLAAYNALRAFSWQLRLSPFSFPDFVAAMTSTQPTPLVDEVHCCVLRVLCIDETPKERAERKLDPALLDHLTWPAYVWEFLALTEDPLMVEEWVHRVPADKRPGAGSTEHGGKKGSGGGKSRKAAPAAQADGAADGEATDAEPAPRRKSFAPLSAEERAAMDAVLEAADPAVPALPPAAETFSAPGVPPQPAPAPTEYHRLPVGLKATILSRLCDHLLDCLTIRAEVDRREAAGELVAGKGGAGGAFPIMTEEERKAAEEKAAKLELTDANADVCVLCGVGGTLLCCDACPAAYHVRCVGESSRTAGATSWFCPECRVGGRGECAGLRIPVAARNRWKQPLHLMHGTVCRSAPPAVRSSGKHAEELEDGPIPAAWYHGEAAQKELAAATRVKGQDEVPPASAYDAVAEPPEIREEEYEWGAGPAAYVNRYRHAWPAAVAAINAAIDDAKRRRHRGGIWVPTGTCGRLTVPELPAPLGMPRFSWEQSKLAAVPTVRCGQCKACLRPSLHKPCHAPVPSEGQPQAADPKLATLIAQVVRLENDYWPLAEGPWAGGEGMAFRRAWLAALRSSTSVREVAHALLQLEAALRPVAFVPEWRGSEPNSTAAAAAAAAATPAGGSRPASRAVSRAPSGLDLQGLESQGAQQSADLSASQAGTEGGAGGPATRGGFDAAAAAAAARAADPYDVRYEKLVPAGWEVDKRHHSARVHGINRLPRAMARKAARQSGWKPIQGVKYRKHRWHVSPRTQWIAATERAETTAQLALSLRQLDPMLQVDTLERPRQETGEPFYFASLLAKRPAGSPPEGSTAGATPAGSFEYLLQIRPPTGQTASQQEAVATMLLEQQKALRAQLAAAAAAAGGQGGTAQLASFTPEQAAMLQQAALQLAPAMQQQVAAAYQKQLLAAQQAQQAAASSGQAQPATSPAGDLVAAGVKQEGPEVKAEVAQQQQQQGVEQPAAEGPGLATATAADGPTTVEIEVAAPMAEAAAADGQGEPVSLAPAKLASEAPAEPATAHVAPPAAEPANVPAAGESLPNGSAQQGPAEAPVAVPSPMEVDAGVAPAATPADTPEGQAAAPPAEAEQQAVAAQPAVEALHQRPAAQPAAEAAAVQPAAECANPVDSAAAGPSPMEASQQPTSQQQPTGSEELPAGRRGRSETPIGDDAFALAQFEAPAAAQAAKLRRQEAERAKAEAEAAERAAKLAARQSAANLAQMGMDAAGRAAAGQATSLTTEQLIREAQASREPVWAHESLLPLWLVELYEERLRREAGNAAAREAAASARRQRLAGSSAEEVAAARAAAHQAAADAADACGSCEALFGEKEELDAVWLPCDTCHRWFHGGCVRMSRDQVDSMGEGDAWDCQPCKAFKRQQERAAARNQRQVKAPQAFSPDQDRGRKGGRPPLPAGKRREGEEEEAGARRGSGRSRKRAASEEPADEEGPLDPEEVERRRLERQERIKRRREEQGAPPESEPWFCPVCKYPDRGRPLFECAGCKDSFHFECAGMHAEEGAAKAASGEAVKCLACQGKRVRAPSQAAINAAILAAQRAAGLAPAAEDEDSDEYSEEEEEEEESGSSDEEQGSAGAAGGGEDKKAPGAAAGGAKPVQQAQQVPAATKVLSPLDSLLAELAKAAGVSVHTESSWMDAVLRVLIKVLRLDCAAEFSQPVDLKAFPDYAAEIAQPMDLGTIKSGLHAGKYASPLEVLEHVKLVWANCREYNEEGSDIMAECNSTQQAFEAAWRLEGLPLEAAAWQPQRAAELRQQAAARLTALQQEERARAAAAAAAAAAMVMPNIVVAPRPAAPKPAAPKPAAPKPAQKRKQPEGFQAGVGGMPAAMPGGAPVVVTVAPAGGMPVGGMQAGGGGVERAAPASKRSRAKAGALEGDWQQRAMQALQRLMQLEASEAFHEPVPRDVPGYHDIIKKPRCLEQIQRNLQRSKYANPAELLADVQLVWDNCREYNEPDAPVVAEAAESEAYWRRCWAAAGIYVSQREMDEKAAAAAAARAAAEAGKLDSAWRAAARKILFRMQKVRESSWFWAPVRPEDAPGYHDIISRPMDLAAISDRLKRGGREAGGYASAQEFLADVRLVWDNCRAYNGSDHAITQDAEACRRQFENWWQAAGLTLSGQLATAEAGQQQQRQQGVGEAGAARSLAEDPVLQALMRKLPPEKQQQVVLLLQRMTPDQMDQARAQLQAMAGAQPAPAAPAQPPQAQQAAPYYGQQAAPQGGYPPAFQEPQQQAAFYPQQQQVQVQQVQPGYGAQMPYGQVQLQHAQLQQQQQAQLQQAQLQQQQLLQQQQAPPQQAFYAQQRMQQQQQQPAAQQWSAAPAQQLAAGGWQQPAAQPQQAAPAWQPAARQLLEGLATLPAAAPFLQAQPGFAQGMDLNAVASKLAAGAYARPLDLAADVSRMLQGAAAAPEGSELRIAAGHVQAVFEALWQRLLAPYVHF